MKVKVTYTVDYDQVSNLINQILGECRERLKEASNLYFDVLQIDKTIQSVEEVQKKLDLVANQLDDCVNLAKGYAQTQSELMLQNMADQQSKPEEEETNV
jgi:hypothetical protein